MSDLVVTKTKHIMMVNHSECLNCGKSFYIPMGADTCPRCFSSSPGLEVKTESMLLPKGESAEWCENEHEEKLTSLFIGYDTPVDMDYKHNVLIPRLDELGFQRTEREGDVVHIVPESAINSVREIIDEINQEHDLGLTDDFGDWYGPTKFKLEVSINGSGVDDVIDALEGVLREIKGDFTSGFDRNENGNYTFNMEEIR